MRDVVIPKSSNSLVGQLASLYEVFKGASFHEDLNFDLNQLTFASPLLILPICSYLKTTKSTYIINEGGTIKSYLDTIEFPNGMNSVSEFGAQIQSSNNYIPISVLHREKPADREKLESLFEQMVYKTIDKSGIEGIKKCDLLPYRRIGGEYL